MSSSPSRVAALGRFGAASAATTMKKISPAMPPSPKKWRWGGPSLSSPRIGSFLLVFLVLSLLALNLETIFPFYYQSDDDVSSRVELHRDLQWPSASYFTMEHHPRDRGSRHNHHRRELKNPYQEEERSSGHSVLLPGRLGGTGDEIFLCDRSHPRSDVCYLKGDVRMDSRSSSFVLVAKNASTRLGEERIKPYTRKWEQSCMDIVHEVRVRAVPSPSPQEDDQHEGEHRQGEEHEGAERRCDVYHSVPAVVFTTGGYTGNVYHEFHDGLIPLYITSQHLNREVVFVGVELHNWWLTKYGDVIAQMSNHPVIDFDRDERIHCFPEVTVGLHIHDEMAIEPSLMPGNQTIVDFRNLLDAAYQEELAQAPEPPPPSPASSIGQPRLTIIARNDTRVILNLDEIVGMARELGFWVEIRKPDRTSELKRIYRALNSSDVLLGVHGAAMTHFLFMRPGSVFIQVVPLGTKWAAAAYYGQPAQKLGLDYIGYEIEASESSLSDRYDENDTVLTDPAKISTQGWAVVKEIYLEGQNVRLSLPRFKRTLLDARRKAMAFRLRQRW
ncbi:uncharacterized protein LOC9637657 [Selaginella moellendorffii]|uniref:uncharacterized protein LOC9637657 n=1 Tax=Selaginella moellendorffii TaxID=88036 RepID=UPI000D1C4A2F|nr:uncharacterized protein LOC9637657 [Selaginella moellendorffii]|eukprot:XP_024519223.1 uncharacterized protein LOC9637657 [Selaginella moellendorffii]